MTKSKSAFTCKECGTKSLVWRGKCPDCGAWDSFVEFAEQKKQFSDKTDLVSIKDVENSNLERIKFNISEFDRILGGGAVAGSAILIAGDPGIGKSTLMLQVASALANQNKKVLYLAGEESPSQIKIRAIRLNSSPDILISNTSGPEDISNIIEEIRPDVAIIDSIQSLSSGNFSLGTTSMLREAVSFIIPSIKKTNTICFFIGHVTKDGVIAGPKSVEHVVDVVIGFESDNSNLYRLLRASKNRFGPTDEVGVFSMTNEGLKEVSDPSGLFLSAKPKHTAGSVVVPTLQGTRPLLVEVQALVSKSPLAYPRRTSIGVDSNRLALLTAVLEKTGSVKLFDQDIFINIAGGLKLKEPAIDLGVAGAIYSSINGKPIDEDTILVGEIGLSGEIRPVKHLELRLKEAQKLGFKKALIPKSSIKSQLGMEIIQLNYIMDLINLLG